MSSEEVIDLLRRAYADEIETVTNYLANAINLDGVRAAEIRESLQADVQEELGHAQQLGERLKQLESRPPGSMALEMHQDTLQPPDDPTDVLAVIEGVIEAEDDAIRGYRELIVAAREADDPVTEDLAISLLGDEEAHRREFRGFRMEYRGD